MVDSNQDAKDAPIPNAVNRNAIQEKMSQDNFVSQFAKLGAELLEQTNRPNILTLQQFTPFIPLFNMDKNRYENEQEYRLSMNRLYNRYIRECSINLYEPTIVVRSREDPTELYFLDRRYTRIHDDGVEGKSQRDTVPAALSKAATTTRDQMILDASARDLVSANNTPAQVAAFARVKAESALIQKRFTERNMSPEKRSEVMAENPAVNTTSSSSPDAPTFFLDDD